MRERVCESVPALVPGEIWLATFRKIPEKVVVLAWGTAVRRKLTLSTVLDSTDVPGIGVCSTDCGQITETYKL